MYLKYIDIHLCIPLYIYIYPMNVYPYIYPYIYTAAPPVSSWPRHAATQLAVTASREVLDHVQKEKESATGSRSDSNSRVRFFLRK